MEVKCDFCGKICKKKPYEVRDFKKHYCNRQCFRKKGKNDEILYLWNIYKSTKKISKILNMSIKKIGRVLWGNGIRLTNNRRCKLTKEFLYEEYVIKQKSCEQIAVENNFGGESIRHRLIKFNIPLRSHYFISEFGRKRRKEADNKRYSLKDENGICINGAFYGKEISEKHKEKLRIANTGKPSYKRTEWHRNNLRIIKTGRKVSEETKEKNKNIMIKYYIDHPERLEKTRNVLKKVNESRKGKTYEELYGIEKAKELKKGVSERFKGKPPTAGSFTKESRKNLILPLNDSSIETKTQEFLKILGIEFFTHMWINQIKHKYRCDIFIPVQPGILQKTIIECDGNWFHGNPLKYPIPNKMQLEQIEEDKVRTQEMIEQGYRVIRIWESEIKVMDINKLKNKILKHEDTDNIQ